MLPKPEETFYKPSVIGTELCAVIAERYGLALRPVRPLSGGEECETWLASAGDAAYVVRVSPAWRSPVQLQWTHDLMLFLRPQVSAVTAPLRALDGSSLFLYQGYPAAVYPFVTGKPLDRENSAQRHSASVLLAQMHRAALHSPAASAGLSDGRAAAPPDQAVDDPETIQDPDLDAWYAGLLRQPASLTIGPIHGDYYRRNLLVEGDTITGLLDWDDAHVDFLMQEVAWSAWEFCKTPSGDDWYPERARAYFQAYRAAGGPCTEGEFPFAINFIRRRLREEIRGSLSAAAARQYTDEAYTAAELRAFRRLKELPFSGMITEIPARGEPPGVKC